MSRLQFDNFFRSATGNTPYDYQSRLAGSDSGAACHSQLINAQALFCKQNRTVLAKG